MSAAILGERALGDLCRIKTLELVPGLDGSLRIVVKLLLDAGAKVDVRRASDLRHRLNAILFEPATILRLPEEPELEYRGAKILDITSWDELLEVGTMTVAFHCSDGAAYGLERVCHDEVVDVGGNHRSYPIFEMVAIEGDCVMAIDHVGKRFVSVLQEYHGGEHVVIDCGRGRAWVDGDDACSKVGFYSDFFALRPGRNELAFAGCSEHVTRFSERWR